MNSLEIRQSAKLIDLFRVLDQNIPAQQISLFIEVATNEGITMQNLANKLGLLQSTCSRTVSALSKVHRVNKAGLDLVEAKEDPMDRRFKVVKLSPKGKRLWMQIQDI